MKEKMMMEENTVMENENVKTTDIPENPDNKPDWELQLETMMKDAYLQGISKGGKTFVGLIYEIILEDHKKRVNPAKTVMRIEAKCRRLLGMDDYRPSSAPANTSANTNDKNESEM